MLTAGPESAASAPRVWQVGALCRAVADALDARFNPVAVRGEISGFSRAASGHCYFSIKDETGQIRCAMFRRAASLLGFTPRDGDQVEVRGRLGVYEARGDLQLIVESLQRAGQGALFEQFLRVKARLEAEGLFDAARKRALPSMPRAIGLVTSLGAAALQDVVTALQRRVPHIPVVLSPAAVQGAAAPADLVRALESLYRLASVPGAAVEVGEGAVIVDVILLVRGGGSIEDLWAFNDEQLARTLAASPVPVVSGVGHETDFTIADFVADLRAPTPSAAAELAVPVRSELLRRVDALTQRLARRQEQVLRGLRDRVRAAGGRLRHPGRVIGDLRLTVDDGVERLRRSLLRQTTVQRAAWLSLRMRLLRKDPRQTVRERRLMTGDYRGRLEQGWRSALGRARDRLKAGATLLASLSPLNVLNRGYSIVRRLPDGGILRRADAVAAGGEVAVQLSRGRLTARVLTIEQESEEWPRTGSKTRSTD